MSDPSTVLFAVAGAVIVVGGAVAVLVKAGKVLHMFIRAVVSFLDDWHGTPARPGFDAVPGVPARLAVVEERLERVEDRVTTNGGGSMSDAVDRIERAVSQRPRAPQPRGNR